MCFFVTNFEHLNCQKQATQLYQTKHIYPKLQIVTSVHCMHTPQGSNAIMCSIFDQRFSNIISVIVTTCWQNNPQYKIVCSRKFYVSIWKCSSQPVSFYFFKSQTEPAWQAFEREGKGSFRCERNARGARGGREGNACKETIVFSFLTSTRRMLKS